MRVLSTIIAILALCMSAFGAQLSVPGDHETIQAAVDAAANGDTLFVASGNFTGPGNWDVVIANKDLFILGAGPDFTVLDCADSDTFSHRALVITSESGNTVRIQGIAILNTGEEVSSGGAAILASNVNLTISGCFFRHCLSYSEGGAISVSRGSLRLEGTSIRFGVGYGGAVWLDHAGESSISGCDIDSCYSIGWGGGAILAEVCTLSVSNCFLVRNSIVPGFPWAEYGGALALDQAEVSLAGCAFYYNTSPEYGGAIAAIGSNMQLDSCTFYANQAGVAADNGSDGGALYLDGGTSEIRNCSFSNNYTGWQRGTISMFGANQTEISMSIIAFGENSSAVDGAATVNCTDIYGNELGDWDGDISSQAGINGNFSLDPLFCDIASGDLKLQEDSPCAPGASECIERLGSRRVGCDVFCGDANGDELVNITDAVWIILWIFNSGVPPYDNADASCDGLINITDVVYLISYIFNGGPAPCASCPEGGLE